MNVRFLTVVVCAAALLITTAAEAKNPYKNGFLSVYPAVEGTQIDDLPSNSGHCGICHFDFNGGGQRNPYGLGVEVGINSGLAVADAVLAIENNDSDSDGFSNFIELTFIGSFENTPTFPGLSATNKGNAINIPLEEIEPYLTPSGGTDTLAPAVTVSSPNGGEVAAAESYYAVAYTATDEGGVSSVNLYLSDDGGATFRPVAKNQAPGSGYSWFVPNRPGALNILRVEAVDHSGNKGYDDSDLEFTITATPPGYVPSTFRDMDMPGTQHFEGAILDDPDVVCASCHGNYDTANEPWHNWRGSMMGQAARDPFFFACLAVAEQDAPSVGDLCIRCHSPGGWQEGRSVDTGGDLLNVLDRHGVQCDFCHRAVDHDYRAGSSPAQDVEVLATVDPLPLHYGNGQFINDPAPLRRGPYADVESSHESVQSPFHLSSDLCGLCHDVSSPVFTQTSPGDYTPSAFDEQHPDMEIRNMMPIERTYSEWSQSQYASGGVYAPQFAGNKPDGIVETCQDCHMRDVTAAGSNISNSPTRSDLGLHDFMGGNNFVPDIIASFFPDEVDPVQLEDAKDRAESMLELAATLDLTPEEFGVTVRVTNETGHKLPSGYPEGRRAWVNVKAFDSLGEQVFESGAYDFETAVLSHDGQAKIYEIHPGLSPSLAAAIGLPAGKSFHFVLNDTVYMDNRIPPRGSTNAGLEEIQSPVVDYSYANGQHWDDTEYTLPAEAESVYVTLYYQSTSKEYVEFLRDENHTNSAGADLYNAWVAQGKAAPAVMATAGIGVNVTDTGLDDGPGVKYPYAMSQNYPNPFNPRTDVSYSIAEAGPVSIVVYDVVGREVRTLVDRTQEAGRYSIRWNGRGDDGNELASGVYFIRYRAGGRTLWRKATLLR